MDTKTSPLALLADPSLLKTDALINGSWTAGQASSPRFAVTDPATGQELAQVANLGPIDAAGLPVRRQSPTSDACTPGISVNRNFADGRSE